MIASQNCVFEVASEDDVWAVVVCSRCGIKAKVPVDNAKRGMVYSTCKNPSGEPAAPPPQPIGYGPGTEMKKLLATVGITASPACSCNARAAFMDAREAGEPGWCAANVDEIVGWLREEATKRGLPFLNAAGRLLVRRAIKNARKTDKTDAP